MTSSYKKKITSKGTKKYRGRHNKKSRKYRQKGGVKWDGINGSGNLPTSQDFIRLRQLLVDALSQIRKNRENNKKEREERERETGVKEVIPPIEPDIDLETAMAKKTLDKSRLIYHPSSSAKNCCNFVFSAEIYDFIQNFYDAVNNDPELQNIMKTQPIDALIRASQNKWLGPASQEQARQEQAQQEQARQEQARRAESARQEEATRQARARQAYEQTESESLRRAQEARDREAEVQARRAEEAQARQGQEQKTQTKQRRTEYAERQEEERREREERRQAQQTPQERAQEYSSQKKQELLRRARARARTGQTSQPEYKPYVPTDSYYTTSDFERPAPLSPEEIERDRKRETIGMAQIARKRIDELIEKINIEKGIRASLIENKKKLLEKRGKKQPDFDTGPPFHVVSDLIHENSNTGGLEVTYEDGTTFVLNEPNIRQQTIEFLMNELQWYIVDNTRLRGEVTEMEKNPKYIPFGGKKRTSKKKRKTRKGLYKKKY